MRKGIFNQQRIKARIVEEEIDTAMYVPAGREDYYGPYEEMPIYYVVKIQVKVSFFWATIWKDCTDITDGDSRTIIINRANEICKKLGEKDYE